ncbi:MAG TPA: hypothetical protein VG757_02185 [Devosia sp.]|nr:hypothetical protein [Devosia sp.]
MRKLVSTLVLAGLAAGSAAAQEAQSAYTDVDFAQCTLITSDEMGGTFACPGYKGIPVMIGEGDLRMFVSFGLTSTTEPAAQQTLPPFNHLGPKIEWRLRPDDEGTLVPFATILRWYTQREEGDGEGQVLVVTQLKPGATCHIAYVDALANKDANEKARQAADELAGDFACGDRMPQVIGAFEAFELE